MRSSIRSADQRANINGVRAIKSLRVSIARIVGSLSLIAVGTESATTKKLKRLSQKSAITHIVGLMAMTIRLK